MAKEAPAQHLRQPSFHGKTWRMIFTKTDIKNENTTHKYYAPISIISLHYKRTQLHPTNQFLLSQKLLSMLRYFNIHVYITRTISTIFSSSVHCCCTRSVHAGND